MNISLKHIFFYAIRLLYYFPVSTAIMFWFALVWAIDLSVRPYLLKIILNRVATDHIIFSNLLIPLVLYFSMHLLVLISARLYGYFVDIYMMPRMRSIIISESLQALFAKNHSYFQHHFSGSLANKVSDLKNSLPDIIQLIIERFFAHACALVCAIITLSYVDIRFSCIMITWICLIMTVAYFNASYIARQAAQVAQWGSVITGKLVDVFTNILSIRLFANQTYEMNILKNTLSESERSECQLYYSYFYIWTFYSASVFVLQMCNFYFLCRGRQQGWITVGDFALVLGINQSIISFLWSITKDWSQCSKYYGRISQALQSMLAQKKSVQIEDAQRLQVHRGVICFSNIYFGYDTSNLIFQDISLTIYPKQKVGLVGYSGSGKSTFVNLLLRLYVAQSGSISIDEQDIYRITEESLYENIGVIPQDPFLFHRTIKDNILYGAIGASDDDIIEAAQRAHAHEFIMSLPKQYDTLVGERGITLSGGQRQRIAIARAILKNAPILILDEATSQLDSLTEQYIQESLWSLAQGKTALVIAHRLSTLLHMDRILVFNKGQIVEDGTHGQLIANNGLYKQLWDMQVGGFLVDRVSYYS